MMTSLSLFFAFYSIVKTMSADYVMAAWSIMISMVFDSFDGTVARVTGTTSEFGAEYDSLSDLVAFGVAPAVLIYEWALYPFKKWGIFAAFLYLLCTALRLGRFNVQSGTVEKKGFMGLPSPGGASGIATTVLFYFYIEGGQGGRLGDLIRSKMISPHHVVFLLLTILLALLMVSTVGYKSGKDLSIFKRSPFLYLILAVLLVVLVFFEPQIMMFLLIYTYILSGIVGTIFNSRKRLVEKQQFKELVEGGLDDNEDDNI
jgi:CDP-diacylglycerol--serine O-phosphatidyltransferase